MTTAAAPSPLDAGLATHLAARLQTLIADLEAGLLERSAAVRLALLAALAGEHVLLLGPPGTAKSELARRLHRAFDGARYFERLLTRFSTPEELFGPLSLKALEDDRYERLTDGFLPTAGVAFLDEVFKANSAILNALLTLLNEREFDNGAGRVATPLISVIGASNEVPADDALQAFFDRFLLRVPVLPVSDAAFEALLRLPAGTRTGQAGVPLSAAECREVARTSRQIALGDDALQGCVQLRGWLAERQISVSDRRWRQWIGLMQTAAATEGRTRIDRLDLWLAPFVVCADPADLPKVADWFRTELLQAVPHEAPWLTRAVEAFEQQLRIEESAESDSESDSAGKLALAQSISGAGRGTERHGGSRDPNSMRMLSAQLEAQLRRHYSPVHIAARLAQLDALIRQAGDEAAHFEAAAAQLTSALAGRIWLPPELAAAWPAAHAHSAAVRAALLARLQVCRAGFAALPQDEALPALVPEPLDLPA